MLSFYASAPIKGFVSKCEAVKLGSLDRVDIRAFVHDDRLTHDPLAPCYSYQSQAAERG